MTIPLVQVVIGSTRPGRIGPAVAAWVVESFETRARVRVEIVDLQQVGLPLFDEPQPPIVGEYVHDHTKTWSAIVDRADAFVFVTPEYNHGPNAATKNALDYLHREWKAKAVSFVSYGGISGGMRAAQQLKQVVLALGMSPTYRHVLLPFVHTQITERGFEARERESAELDAAVSEVVEKATEFAARRSRTGTLAS